MDEGVADPADCDGFGGYHALLGPQGSPYGQWRQNEVDCPAIGEADFIDPLWPDGQDGLDVLDGSVWEDNRAKHCSDGLVGGRLAHGEVEIGVSVCPIWWEWLWEAPRPESNQRFGLELGGNGGFARPSCPRGEVPAAGRVEANTALLAGRL